jgi:3-oxocholest-4-en-26-oyl-CoA dehydrogenase beta subunit
MDFSLSETQQDLVGLARQILSDRMTLSHLKEVERSDEGFDRETWNEFAKANLLGICVPEAQGGLGLSFTDLCLVLREVGRYVAPIPAVACLVSSALPCVQFGTEEQLSWMDSVVRGDFIGTAALQEYGTDASQPFVIATPDGDNWLLNGVKAAVPFADIAGAILVPARVAGSDDVVMLNVLKDASGMTLARQVGQNYEHLYEVTFNDTPAGREGQIGTVEQGREILEWTLDRTMLAMCAVVGGTCDEAVKITAQYTIDRKQFDRQIGTFQAVSQRMGDAYINNQAIELTMLQAASHLDEGKHVPDEVATAKWWACEGGNQIGHACLHIHGGISIDLDYPIHRYFLWIKQAEFTLGSATAQLRRIGAMIAS